MSRGAIAALLSGSLVGGVGACGVPGGDAGRGKDADAPSTTEPAADHGDALDGTGAHDGPGGQADEGSGGDNAAGGDNVAGGDGAGDEGIDEGIDDPVTTGGVLRGYWVWEQRVQGTGIQSGDVDRGQMKVAFGDGNDRCHYIWNETRGSDFHTECTYSVDGDLVRFEATADADATAAGYSCAHPDWTSWNDRPAVQWGRYRFVGDRLWIGVNTYWGFGGGVEGVPPNGSLKRFSFWESEV